MVRGLGMDEAFYGWTVSILAASCVAACLVYGFLARRWRCGR